MHYLYVDVTAGMTLGLLDDDFNWVEYKESAEKKPSEVIHQEIFRLINAHNVQPEQTEYFFASGPGSYTGMRLGEGIAQILEWSGRKIYSFHQFEVPQIMGIKKGYWMTNAFKGQVFLHTWENDQVNSQLLNTNDVKIIDDGFGFTLTHDHELFIKLKTSKELISTNPQKFFKNIKTLNMRKSPYYFRSLEEEFKQC